MSGDEEREAQLERARQTWELYVFEAPDPKVLAAIRKIVRVKRFELPALADRLPCAVRRGARVDLAPLEEALLQAGVRCELRRSRA